MCAEENLLGGTHFSIDGLKLPSNAAKEWSGTHADLRTKQQNIEKKVKKMVKEHRIKDKPKKKSIKDDDNDNFKDRILRLEKKTKKLVCPAGKELYISGTNMKVNKGYVATGYKARVTDCRGCSLRNKCLRNPSTPYRQVRIFHKHLSERLLDKMKQKIDTLDGRKTYSKRMGIVEPVFGNIRSQKRMDRFTLRGKIKVDIQFLLYCIVHNIEKVANYGRSYAFEEAWPKKA